MTVLPGADSLLDERAPGTYTVKLSAGGREQTERLTVRKDINRISF